VRKINSSTTISIFLLIGLVALAWTGCGKRLVNEEATTRLQIPLSAELMAAKSLAAADLYRLTITDETADSVLALVSLTRNQAVLEGLVEDLPAGRTLSFLVEAVESETGVVIYQGSATAIVVADQTITLDIPLGPVVPLQRLTPMCVPLVTDSSFVLDTRIHNVDSLFGISFRVHWPVDFPLRVDSAQPGDDVSSPNIIFFAQEGTGAFYTFSITQTGAGETLVDASGQAHLAKVFFTVQDFANAPAGTFPIEVEPTGLTGVDSTIIPLGDIYTDDCTLLLGEFIGQ